MNLCVFTGRVTRDPELRTTTNGHSVVDFGIAINEGKDKDATFVNLQAWNEQADFAVKWLKVGKPISVQARLKNERWVDKTTGENRRAERFVVDRFSFVPGEAQQEKDSPSVDSKADAPQPKKRGPKAKNTSTSPSPQSPSVDDNAGFQTGLDDSDDDIPF